MKKNILIQLFVLLALSLVACNNNIVKSTENTLSVSQLTDREKAILSTTSDKSFVFDFKVDPTYKKVSLWVEKYELGKKVANAINPFTTEVKDKGTIIFTTSKTTTNQKQSQFTISMNSNGATDTSSNLETMKVKDVADIKTTWRSTLTENNPITGKMVLASICYGKGDSITSLSTDFYKDIDSHMNELKAYEVVYLLRCEFIRKLG